MACSTRSRLAPSRRSPTLSTTLRRPLNSSPPIWPGSRCCQERAIGLLERLGEVDMSASDEDLANRLRQLAETLHETAADNDRRVAADALLQEADARCR